MTEHRENKPGIGPGTPLFEVRDANLPNLLKTGAGLFGLVILSLLVSWGLYILFRQHSAAPGSTPETFTIPQGAAPLPRLQQDPHADLLAMRSREDSILTSYGWVNRDSGFARVPIDRALEILAAKGLPVRRDTVSGDHQYVRH
jgi:hypothetical protein